MNFAAILFAMLLATSSLFGQQAAVTSLKFTVAPGATISTPIVKLVHGQVVSITGASTDLAISVHEENGIVLDQIEQARWVTPNDALYYFVIANAGASEAPISIDFPPEGRDVPSPRKNAVIVTILFATDRKEASAKSTPKFFANEPDPQQRLNYGTADVSIPPNHRIGELEDSFLRRLGISSKDTVDVVSSKTLYKDGLLGLLGSELRRPNKTEVLLFVHGFNVSFEDAARRLAQVSYDLGFKGVPVLFSWASRDQVLSYRVDRAQTPTSGGYLSDFLKDLLKTAQAIKPNTSVHILAHSMGNVVLASALQKLEKDGALLPQVADLILMAPDLDAIEFFQNVASWKRFAQRITLYASNNDFALLISSWVNWRDRAGRPTTAAHSIPGVDLIDVSKGPRAELQQFGLNHSYFGNSRTILADLFHLIRGDPPEGRFGLSAAHEAKSPGIYLQILP